LDALEFAYTVRKMTARIIMAGQNGRPEHARDLAGELSTITGRFIAAEEKRRNGLGGGPTLETPGEYDLTTLTVEEDPEAGE